MSAGEQKDAADDRTTPDQKRRDQLLRMSGSSEADAAPRIEVTEHDGITRIDIADDAAVRPGPGPGSPLWHPESDEDEPRDLREAGVQFDHELLDAEAEADEKSGA